MGEKKIALFCCIPDSDKSLNYLVGMIYGQLIQTLYFVADRKYKGRLPVPVIHSDPDYKFEIGKGIVLKEGTDVTIFATGLCVNETIEAEKMLAADGINAEIINIHTIKPLDRELVVKSALKTGKVVTVEEHSVIGGLGSAVCDVLCEEAPTKVLKIGINDVFGESGPALELIKKYGLDAEGIYKKVKAFVK